jgi:hypothetical protein
MGVLEYGAVSMVKPVGTACQAVERAAPAPDWHQKRRSD